MLQRPIDPSVGSSAVVVPTGAPEQSLVVYSLIVLLPSALPTIAGVRLFAGESGDVSIRVGASTVVVLRKGTRKPGLPVALPMMSGLPSWLTSPTTTSVIEALSNSGYCSSIGASKLPSPLPRRIERPLPKRFAVTRSRWPSPFRSAARIAKGELAAAPVVNGDPAAAVNAPAPSLSRTVVLLFRFAG